MRRLGPGTARQLERNGVPATATVRSIGRASGGGPSPRVDLELDVRVGEDTAYPWSGRLAVSRGVRLQEGDELAVRIDPEDRQELVVDWPRSWSNLIRKRGTSAG